MDINNIISLPSGKVFNFISQLTFGESLISLLLLLILSFLSFSFVVFMLDKEGVI